MFFKSRCCSRCIAGIKISMWIKLGRRENWSGGGVYWAKTISTQRLRIFQSFHELVSTLPLSINIDHQKSSLAGWASLNFGFLDFDTQPERFHFWMWKLWLRLWRLKSQTFKTAVNDNNWGGISLWVNDLAPRFTVSHVLSYHQISRQHGEITSQQIKRRLILTPRIRDSSSSSSSSSSCSVTEKPG